MTVLTVNVMEHFPWPPFIFIRRLYQTLRTKFFYLPLAWGWQHLRTQQMIQVYRKLILSHHCYFSTIRKEITAADVTVVISLASVTGLGSVGEGEHHYLAGGSLVRSKTMAGFSGPSLAYVTRTLTPWFLIAHFAMTYRVTCGRNEARAYTNHWTHTRGSLQDFSFHGGRKLWIVCHKLGDKCTFPGQCMRRRLQWHGLPHRSRQGGRGGGRKKKKNRRRFPSPPHH